MTTGESIIGGVAAEDIQMTKSLARELARDRVRVVSGFLAVPRALQITGQTTVMFNVGLSFGGW